MPSSKPPFEIPCVFTDAEWDTINEAFLVAKLMPLSIADRNRLNWIARAFQDMSRSDRKAKPVVVKRWIAVAKSAAKLKAALAEAKRDARSPDPFFWAEWTSYDQVDERKFSSFEEALEQYAQVATLTADLEKESIKPQGKKNLREQLYQELLRAWFEHGGKITYATEVTGPSGPLIKYLRSATPPVMGAEAPADETIKSFLVRTDNAGKRTAETLGPTWLGELWAVLPKVR